jgi:hypothetical protein
MWLSQKCWFLGTKRVNAFRQRIFGPQRFKTRLGNQSAIKRSLWHSPTRPRRYRLAVRHLGGSALPTARSFTSQQRGTFLAQRLVAFGKEESLAGVF